MGYVVLHLSKATGTDVGMSSHIERRIHPANADETMTYLNEELVEFPQGVANRTEAIQHRLDNAGLERKIGKNQVRALRVMLSGSPEDMKRIRQAGQLDAWAKDSCGWLQKTFGKENVVSAVLHLDEKTPHIHATVVPITRGERRKAKLEREKNAQSGKRTYRTKKDRPRLCADDVMARDKLKAYQTTYAEAMAKYGLRRGVEGSEAKHISTQQYYREVFVRKNEIAEQVANLKKQQQTLSVDIAALKAQQADAQADYHTIDVQRRKKQQELEQAKRELTKTQVKQKAAAATETVLDGIVSLFDDSRQKKARQELDALKQENTDLRNTIGTIQADHRQEQAQLKQKTMTVRNELARVYELFPQVRGLMRWESYCRSIGLNQEWTKALFTLRPYKFTGELTSTEFQRPFHAQDAILQFRPDKDGPGRFRFTIDGKDDGEWFRQQRNDAIRRITGIDVERNPKIKRGI